MVHDDLHDVISYQMYKLYFILRRLLFFVLASVFTFCLYASAETNNARAYFIAAEVSLKSDNPNEAYTNVSKAIELNAKYSRAYNLRGFLNCAYFTNYDAAISDCSKAIELNPKFASPYSIRGIANRHLKHYTNALEDLNKAIELNLVSTEVYKQRGIVKFYVNDYNGCVADLDKAIELSHQTLYQLDAETYAFRGSASGRLLNYKSAIEDFNKAIELDSKYTSAYKNRGIAKSHIGDYAGSIDDLTKAIALEPSVATSYLERGLAEKVIGDDTDALKDFQYALKLDKNNANAFAYQGYVQNDLFQWQSALDSFRASLDNDSSLSYSRFRIWLIRVRIGQTSEATKELESFLKSFQDDTSHNWEVQIGQYLVGTLSQVDFLKAAKAGAMNVKNQNGQLCESYYYIGMKHLILGDRVAAINYLTKCLNTEEIDRFEYGSAKAELNALKSN